MSRWALLVATLLVYAPTLSGDLVWDDVILIRDNAAIDTWAGAWDVAWGDFFRQGDAQQARSSYVRPLPTLLNAATKAIVGTHPLAYRATNLALHLLAVFLAMGVLVALGLSERSAVLGAAVFALHPAQTEAVAFVSSRPDLLAAVFALGAVRLHLAGRAGWAVLAVAAGLLSKEVALAVPFALFALDRRPRWVWPVYLALAAAVLLPKDPVARMYFDSVPQAALALVALYTRLIVAPYEQRALYDGFTPDLMLSVVGAAVVAGAAYLAIQRRAPTLAWGAWWTGLCLAPVLHLVPIPTLAAERYLCLPLFGVAVVVAWIVERRLRLAPAVVGLCVVAAMASAWRAQDWRDEVSLWSAEIARPEPSYKAFQNLAVAFADTGRHEDALLAIQAASRAAPRHPIVFRNLVRMSARAAPLPDGFAADALRRPLDRDRVARWEPPLRAQGRLALAEAVRRIKEDHQ